MLGRNRESAAEVRVFGKKRRAEKSGGEDALGTPAEIHPERQMHRFNQFALLNEKYRENALPNQAWPVQVYFLDVA